MGLGYPDLEDGVFIKVKLLQYGGDWFMVPNSRAEEFNILVDKCDEEGATEEDNENFEASFGKLRTEGDLNNFQFYRSMSETIKETLDDNSE